MRGRPQNGVRKRMASAEYGRAVPQSTVWVEKPGAAEYGSEGPQSTGGVYVSSLFLVFTTPFGRSFSLSQEAGSEGPGLEKQRAS